VVSLATAPPGEVRIARISEKIELDDDALRLLAGARLIPVRPRRSCAASRTASWWRATPASTRSTDVARLTFVSPC
jgi:hypothetical protein